MHFIDWLMVIVPIVFVLCVAVYTNRFVRSVADFLAGMPAGVSAATGWKLRLHCPEIRTLHIIPHIPDFAGPCRIGENLLRSTLVPPPRYLHSF